MSVGDAVFMAATVADGGYLAATPGVGIEWVIHNFHAPSASYVEVYLGVGAPTVANRLYYGKGGWMNIRVHAKYTNDEGTTRGGYLIHNVSGGAIVLGYDGMVTK